MTLALEISGLCTGYGSAQVLFDAGLTVAAGEAVALLGRNGMGKTTLIRGVLGLNRITSGRIAVRGRDVTGLPAHLVARSGIGWVPEGRQIFAGLSVEENLLVAARPASNGGWSLSDVYDLFPRLLERRSNFGDQLSGGEQQMLAIGRALLTQPAVLILDEATEGLAPQVRLDIWRTLATLKARGQAVLIVDRDLKALAGFADRFVVLEKGRVVLAGIGAQLASDPARVEKLLSV
jgi:branched-chain amino acid transport system ATP-binding protein